MAEAIARVLDFLATRTRAERLRSRLAHHVELHAKLPQGSAARQRLGSHLDVLTDKLVELERAELDRRRDAAKIATGFVMTGLFAVVASAGVRAGGWWLLTLVATIPLTLAGFLAVLSDIRGQPHESSTGARRQARMGETVNPESRTQAE